MRVRGRPTLNERVGPTYNQIDHDLKENRLFPAQFSAFLALLHLFLFQEKLLIS